MSALMGSNYNNSFPFIFKGLAKSVVRLTGGLSITETKVGCLDRGHILCGQLKSNLSFPPQPANCHSHVPQRVMTNLQNKLLEGDQNTSILLKAYS